jgi:hypothetical protein
MPISQLIHHHPSFSASDVRVQHQKPAKKNLLLLMLTYQGREDMLPASKSSPTLKTCPRSKEYKGTRCSADYTSHKAVIVIVRVSLMPKEGEEHISSSQCIALPIHRASFDREACEMQHWSKLLLLACEKDNEPPIVCVPVVCFLGL